MTEWIEKKVQFLLQEVSAYAKHERLDEQSFADLLTAALSEARQEALREVPEIISKHNVRILNEFQAQGKPDMPMIAYDERVCLIPAMTEATKVTLAALTQLQASKEV